MWVEFVTFENKLLLFAEDLQKETLTHFPFLREHRKENNAAIYYLYFRRTILNMRERFQRRCEKLVLIPFFVISTKKDWWLFKKNSIAEKSKFGSLYEKVCRSLV